MNNIDFPFPKVLLLGWLITLSSFSQTNDSLTGVLIERIDSVSKRIAPESIYFQTSKGIYETEEDLWFKAYILDSQLFTPSTRDKTLYVQLIHDKSNKTVWQEKYEIENGFVDGHLYLQDSLLIGSYHLVAYTSHSIFKSTNELDAVRKLQIVKKIEHKNNTIHSKKDSIIDFSTFPEGGNLISGMKNKLAYKAVNSIGEPVFVSGTLFENNLPLLEFNSTHAGMGIMDFTPDINKKYHIKLSEPIEGRRYTIPEIKRGGINLRLTKTTKDYLMFEITQNTKYVKGNIHFRLQSKGIVYSMATAELKNNLKIKVPLNNLPQGIVEATLYNGNLIPICERLVYVNQDRKLTIQTFITDEFNTREKAKLKIKVTDQNEKPVIAHLGLSIYDNIYQNVQDPKNILTHYFLSTQLKGRIYNPAYYFNKNNKNRLEALDLLLLTQGWRKYVWNETNLIENDDINEIVISDNIIGQVRAQKKRYNQPFEPPTIMAYVPDKKELLDIVVVDTLGQFTVTPKHLKMGEGGYVYLRMFASNESKFNVNLKDNDFKTLNSIKKSIIINYSLPNSNKVEKDVVIPYIPSSDVTQLEEVMIKTKKKKIKRDKYLGRLDSLAKLELTTDYVCKENILNCPIHGSHDKGSKKPIEEEIYYMHWRTRYKINGRSVEGGSDNTGPLFNPPHPPYHYPVLTDEYLMSRYNLIRTKGFYGKKEFYQPNYDQETLDDSFPDYRNTLVWNPTIITDKKGEATIEFYCSDLNSKFIGNIEGVSGDGLLGNGSFEFVVKK